MSLREGIEILKLEADELEELVKKWLAQEKATYVDFERYSGSYDRGLDAVGFLTNERHAGVWDNFQCKQLARSLGETEFLIEIGKVFYYSSIGEFTLPRRYIFVAPNGVSKNVRTYVGSPEKIRKILLDEWDKTVGNKIIQGKSIELTNELKGLISKYDFSKIEAWNNHKLIEQPNLRKVLHFHIDINPGKAPAGSVPNNIEIDERPYISQLIQIYSDDGGISYSSESEIYDHKMYGRHLVEQRRRYYDAEAFNRHFRDNIAEETLTQFTNDIYDGVFDEYFSLTGITRVTAVMKSAGALHVSGVFGKHNSAPGSVKQGVCHQLANIGRLPWKE